MSKTPDATSLGTEEQTNIRERLNLILDIALANQSSSRGRISDQDNQMGKSHLADNARDDNTDISLLSNGYGKIKQIRAALIRLTDGTYGICGGCDQQISAGRLEAEPCAILCISCKSAEENNDRH